MTLGYLKIKVSEWWALALCGAQSRIGSVLMTVDWDLRNLKGQMGTLGREV